MATVLAYGTERQAYFELFMASCRRFGIKPVLLGWGEPWSGTCQKLISICSYLRTLPEDEVVISVDPFDVIFLKPLDSITCLFEAQPEPFLCGALKLHSFNARVYEHEFNRSGQPTPHTPSGYNFLNAGTWISRAGYARRLLKDLLDTGVLNACLMDQEVFTSLYISSPERISLDWQCRIFHNLLFKDFISRRADLEDLEFLGNVVKNTCTGTEPCILHASGNTRMKEIALALAYELSLCTPVRDMKNYFSKALFHFGKILRISWNEMSLPDLRRVLSS